MDYYLAFILLAHLWSNTDCQGIPGYELKVNKTVDVQRGLCVRVPCTFIVPLNIRLTKGIAGIWFHFIEGSGQHVAFRVNNKHYSNGRFYLIGDVTRGDCSFIIEGAMNEDAGSYGFRIVDEETKLLYPDVLPNVQVTEFTEKPTISFARLVEGKEVTLTCTSPGRCRKVTPEISWIGKVSNRRIINYEITRDDGSRSFHSNITFTPGKSDNNSPLYCTVTLKTGVSTTEKQSLSVEYSPSINITIEGVVTSDTSSVTVKDGDTITMRCSVDSNPKASITWYKEDAVVNWTRSFQTISLTLTNVTPSDAGRFLCSAENEHGVINKTFHIIHHGEESKSKITGDNTAIAAAVGGVISLVLILVVGAVLFIYFRKKRQQNINGNLKDIPINDSDAIYCSPEFTTP
ncbi:hypothetical protein GDO81_014721, partial [Engystomops pustulosus]